MAIYGYCRISTKTQNIERQVRNIKAAYPTAVIVCEVFTGTKVQGRKKLDGVLRVIRPGDTLVFDSASRMSRNEQEAVELYESLFNAGVDLVFLKEPSVNTATYRKALENQIQITATTGNKATDDFIQSIIQALNDYNMALAKQQIALCFSQAQKEVEDLHQRTKEGIETARLNGKQIGLPAGAKLNVKKANAAKEIIRKHSVDFGGSLDDTEAMKLAGVCRNSFYKYKREIREEIAY